PDGELRVDLPRPAAAWRRPAHAGPGADGCRGAADGEPHPLLELQGRWRRAAGSVRGDRAGAGDPGGADARPAQGAAGHGRALCAVRPGRVAVAASPGTAVSAMWDPFQREVLAELGHAAYVMALPEDPMLDALLRAAGRSRASADAATLARIW